VLLSETVCHKCVANRTGGRNVDDSNPMNVPDLCTSQSEFPTPKAMRMSWAFACALARRRLTRLRKGSLRRRTSADQVAGRSMRRTVRVRCAASENPERCAASVTVAPFINSPHACCRRSHKMYGRTGTPTDSVTFSRLRPPSGSNGPNRSGKLPARSLPYPMLMMIASRSSP
jgi:hypothetical protein